MKEDTHAYCQLAACKRKFKREKGETLGDFITCSKECEKAVVYKNINFLLPLYQEKYYVPEPAELVNNNIAFVGKI